MATTAPTRVTDLARQYRIDINTAADPGTNYEQLLGIKDAKLIVEPRTVPDEVYEEGGAMREEVTGYSWRLEITLGNSLNPAGTSRNSVHSFIRSKHLALRTNPAATSEFGIQWYHRDGLAGEAHEGRVYAKTWTPPGGTSLDDITLVLQGQGVIADITNPASSQLPGVTGLTPSTGPAAGGEIVNIFGHHFTGATQVDFGASTVPTSDWTFVSDSHIVAISPAVAPSTVQVKVTTPAGASPDVAADNYTYV